MPFYQPDTLRYFSFESLETLPVTHGIFTRRGGVSPSPWESLNTGATVGDASIRVGENRRRIFESANRSIYSIFDVWQVHSDVVVCAGSPRSGLPHQQADAILTDNPEVTLFMRFADCVPILLVDARKGVIGMVHSGWQGSVKFIAQRAVETMVAQYGSSPADIWAGIGPSIAAHHYPVGQDVVDRVRAAFGSDAETLLPVSYGTKGSSPGSVVQFDLWDANRLVLERAGVTQIEIAGICTSCHLEDWYSHRGEKGRTGRFGALICLGKE